jgi:hypothetical protein
MLATVFSAFSNLTNNPALTFLIVVIVFVLLIFLVHFVSKYFEYDSDGLKVIVINRGLLIADKLNYREHQIEFYKENLISYKIHNYIVYKTLVIYYKDEKDRKQKATFNVSLVNNKKRKYIKQSLSKMIKYNRKLKESK